MAVISAPSLLLSCAACGVRTACIITGAAAGAAAGLYGSAYLSMLGVQSLWPQLGPHSQGLVIPSLPAVVLLSLSGGGAGALAGALAGNEVANCILKG